MFRLFLFGALSAAGSACAQPPAQAQRAQAAFEAYCAACHTPAPGAPVGDLSQRSPADYAAFARAVRSGEGPSGEMPAFTPDLISEADLRALHDYINRTRARR